MRPRFAITMQASQRVDASRPLFNPLSHSNRL